VPVILIGRHQSLVHQKYEENTLTMPIKRLMNIISFLRSLRLINNIDHMMQKGIRATRYMNDSGMVILMINYIKLMAKYLIINLNIKSISIIKSRQYVDLMLWQGLMNDHRTYFDAVN
jgi:tRNA G26 N,N-dimethylase Trm1